MRINAASIRRTPKRLRIRPAGPVAAVTTTRRLPAGITSTRPGVGAAGPAGRALDLDRHAHGDADPAVVSRLAGHLSIPRNLGISAWDFVLKFGRHLPGGGPSDSPPRRPQEPAAKEATPAAAPAEGASKEPAASPAPADSGRWKLSGKLDIDCMICHCNNHEYSMELWSKQIEDQNFAWAPTVALGLGFVDGKVSALPDDFDPAKVEENARNKLPTTTYATGRVNAEKKVFFDVIRQPSDNTCYYCHSRQLVGKDAVPDWNCDEDVHLKAGLDLFRLSSQRHRASHGARVRGRGSPDRPIRGCACPAADVTWATAGRGTPRRAPAAAQGTSALAL